MRRTNFFKTSFVPIKISIPNLMNDRVTGNGGVIRFSTLLKISIILWWGDMPSGCGSWCDARATVANPLKLFVCDRMGVFHNHPCVTVLTIRELGACLFPSPVLI